MNDPTVPLWIITEDDGTVLSAHCTLHYAGQAESCSQIGSVLFHIKTFNTVRGKLACTNQICASILPTYHKDAPFAVVQGTDFKSTSN